MLEILLILAVIAADQVSKYFSEMLLSPVGTSFPIVRGVFHITSAHNAGAAWGMLQGGKWFFLILTGAVCIFVAWLLIGYRKKMTVFARICLSLLLAGAIGNMIDRIVFSYVRDMLDFCLINFPIFNIADSALTIACFMLIFDALFLKERSVFELKLKKTDAKADRDDGKQDNG